jgi:hypothetical protein
MARPSRMVLPRGSVCFRDARCWHRGMPRDNLIVILAKQLLKNMMVKMA